MSVVLGLLAGSAVSLWLGIPLSIVAHVFGGLLALYVVACLTQ